MAFLDEIINFEREKLVARGYNINYRTFGTANGKEGINSLFSPDYKAQEFYYPDSFVVYSGAEHAGEPKLMNITVLPNLVTKSGRLILGSTFGHQHLQAEKGDTRAFQEIYESLGYGGMLIRNADGIFLYALNPGTKVLVGASDNMAIFNLDTKPLVTLDYANPKKNSANKNLEHDIGSLLMLGFGIDEHEKGQFEAIVNKEYEKRKLIQYDERTLKLENAFLGKSLYDRLKESFALFRKMGVELRFGGNLPDDLEAEFSPSLLELVLNQNKTLLGCLEM